MQVAQGSLGRVFVVKLEDGDSLPHSLEQFARENEVERALCAMIGGADKGRLVVGPEDGQAEKITPMLQDVEGAHEAVALGTIFPDEAGEPKLHMHASLGRGDEVRTGCVRQGVDIWRIGEVIVLEILGTSMGRLVHPAFGFEILGRQEP